jgi:hypothetical protein
VNTEGPLALLWVGIGLGAFFTALIWLNTLLPLFLTPLFVIPLTWVLEKFGVGRPPAEPDAPPATSATPRR